MLYINISCIFCVQLAILVHCSTVLCGRVKRVVGGVEVKCGALPHVASLRNASNLQHLCGATMLSPEFAITAAHCVSREERHYLLQLDNYCLRYNETPPTAVLLEIRKHKQYDRYTRAHDIALLRVKLNLEKKTNLFDKAILPSSSFGVSGECIVAGYGVTNITTMDTSKQLLAAKVKLSSLDHCIEHLGPIAPAPDSGMMCASGNQGDTCQGDSGGPLMCGEDLTLEGVSSYGLSCGVPGVPAVYTSVGAHLRWIESIITHKLLE